MFDFLIFAAFGLSCMYAGAYFHGPVLNGASYVGDWIAARFKRKP